MAKRTGKTPNRLELRKAAEAAEKKKKDAPASKAKAKKAPAKKGTRRKSAKSSAPERLRMVWGVFDNSNQQVAAFPYAQRQLAEKKIEDLAGKGRGPYFIQPVKEPIIETAESDAEAKEEE